MKKLILETEAFNTIDLLVMDAFHENIPKKQTRETYQKICHQDMVSWKSTGFMTFIVQVRSIFFKDKETKQHP